MKKMLNRVFAGFLLIGLTGGLGGLLATADASFTATPKAVIGSVYTRGLVLGENDKPIFATFNEQGETVEIIGEAVGEMDQAEAMPAEVYRAYVDAFQKFLDDNRDGVARAHRVLTKEEYQQESFVTIDDKPVTKPSLRYPKTRSVVVRDKAALLTPTTDPILLESPIDLTDVTFIPPNARSVLVSKLGRVLKVSDHNIGYRSAYLQPGPDQPNGCTVDTAYGPDRDNEWMQNIGKDALCAPVAGAELNMWTWYGDLYSFTNTKGKFVLSYLLMPCPGFDFEFTHLVFQKIYYSSFHPRARAPRFRYQERYVYDYCLGSGDMLAFSGNLAGLMTYTNILAIRATIAEYIPRLRFPIDVMALTGWGDFSNAPFGGPVSPGATQYSANLPGFEQVPPADWDFDSDGNADRVEAIEGKPDWGVWLHPRQSKDESGAPVAPDFTIVPHSNPDFGHQGLLSQLGEDDLRDTDLYVYRVSTGERIAEKKGLPDLYDADAGTNRVYVSMLLPTGQISEKTRQRLANPFESGQAYNDAYLKRNIDSLRPGEQVKLIAVNRKTGYIGTATTTLTSAQGGRIDVPLYGLVLGPPNLKITAKRQYSIEGGLTAGENRTYLIGFEGSAVTSDSFVAITTEWYDRDGTALPADLPGYTGRITKTAGDKALQEPGVAHFGISPGTQLQLLRLNGTELVNEHYYVQVNGQPISVGLPDFGGTGAGDGVLGYRPKYYVPIQVPIFDESETRQRRNALIAAQRTGADVSDFLADAAYRWVYRPEMQFSVYDLTVKDLQTTDIDGTTRSYRTAGYDEFADTVPGFSTSDDFISILYDLAGSTFEALDPLGGATARQLIFAVGEQEVVASLDEGGRVQLSNLNHLISLQPEDYFTLRLYQSGDADNLLWQFAFEVIDMLPRHTVGEVLVSADANVVPLFAHLPGYQNRPAENQHEYLLTWVAQGGGHAQTPFSRNRMGQFYTDFVLPTKADSVVQVEGRLGGGGTTSLLAKSARFRIVPGQPHSIEVESSGRAAIAGLGEIELKVTIKDKAENFVADGTALKVLSTGALSISSDFQTKDGVVSLRLKGVETAGQQHLTFTSGDATAELAITIDPINLAVSIPGQIAPEQTVDVKITATSPAGTVDGVDVLLRTSRGELKTYKATFQNGEANTQLYSGPFEGTALFSAQVASAVIWEVFTVAPEETGGGSASLSIPLIMGDATSGGTLSVTDEDGAVYSFDYAAQTVLTVTGEPGETLPLKIGSFAVPAIEPLLHLPMFSLGGGGQVFDRYGIIDAFSTDVVATRDSPKGFRGSLRFGSAHPNLPADGSPASAVRVPNHTALDKATEIGFSLNFKPEDAGGELVNFALRSQRLQLTGDNRVQFSIATDEGDFSVSSAAVALNEWHEVAAYYQQGQLQLSVDGQLFAAPASGALKRQTATSAIQLGQGYRGLMNEFRVIDWTLPRLAVFQNGQDEMSVVLDSSGKASVTVSSTGMMGQRGVQTQEEGGFAIALGFFIPSAQAGWFDGGGPGFLSSVLAGANKVALAVVDTGRAAAELGQQVAAGVLLGDTSTPAGAAADLVLGFLPFVGDSRDLALQSYYALVGDEKYDELIVILASIGLAADAASAAGVAASIPSGGTSLTLTVVGQIFKSSVKVIKRFAKLIPKGPFRDILTAKFREILIAIKETRWEPISHALSVTGLLVAVVGDEDLRELIFGAIQSVEDFDAWATYLGEYEDGPEVAGASSELFEGLLDALISSAYAGKVDDYVVILRRILDDGLALGVNSTNQVGEVITDAIALAAKHGDNIELRALKYETQFFRATFVAFGKIGELGIVGIVRANKGLRNGLPGYADFIKAIDELIEKSPDIFSGSVNGAGIRHIFADLASDSAKVSHKIQGAVHHIHAILWVVRRNGVIKGIEQSFEIVTETGTRLGKRIYDHVFELDGKVIHADAKSWHPDYVVSNVRDSLRKKPTYTKDANGNRIETGEQGDQLFLDMAKMFEKRDDPSFLIQWQFDKRVSPAQRDEIVKTLKEEMSKNGKAAKELFDTLGLKKGVDDKAWDNFIEDLSEKIPDMIKVVEN